MNRGTKRDSMSIEENVQTVKDVFAAIGRGDKQGLLASSGNPAEPTKSN
jgi:ketosteroid isomerase-like protein